MGTAGITTRPGYAAACCAPYAAAKAADCARIASTSFSGGITSRITMSGAASGATSAPCMVHCHITTVVAASWFVHWPLPQ
jgi:hypothetical protein